MKSILFILFAAFWCISGYSQSGITYTFDKLGRMKSEKIAGLYNLQFSYDKEGNVIAKSVTDITGLEVMKRPDEDLLFKVYPNPTNRDIAIEVMGNRFDQKIALYDVWGRILEERVIIESQTRLSLEGYDNGIYYLLIKSGSETVPFKILKQ